jgi:integrase
MPRDRHQNGWLTETGKKRKKWKGHYHAYEVHDGTEKRVHKAVILGPKSELAKWEAREKLKAHIESQKPPTKVRPHPGLTFAWFWEHRFRPIKEPTWKESARPHLLNAFKLYVLPYVGHMALGEITRFILQEKLNELAGKYSRSVVLKFRVWTCALLDEAVEQGFIVKNPADKLVIPQTRTVDKRTLTEVDIALLLAQLEGKFRLIMRIALVCGLRPGEILSLRWNDFTGAGLRIDETVARSGKVFAPKTEFSKATVWLPRSLRLELEMWREQTDSSPEALMFPSDRGTPYNISNVRNRVLLIAGKKSGVSVARFFQAARRTCATFLSRHGTVKDVQAHLRHADAETTLNEYVQEIPAHVRAAVESLDLALSGNAVTRESVN